MKKSLEMALPFAEAFARLLHPFAEVVIHDLEKDQIEAIFNPLSKREVGDSSYLDRVDFKGSERVIGPYPKTNWDGRAMKSISVVLQGTSGKPEGFLCVNIDLSAFASVNRLLQGFLETVASEKHTPLFKEDLYEQINQYVQEYCRERHLSLDALAKGNKQEIIRQLSEQGAFKGRNAATYVGRVLGISRATVYNYLNQECGE